MLHAPHTFNRDSIPTAGVAAMTHTTYIDPYEM